MKSAIFTLSKNSSLGSDNSIDWTCAEDKAWFQNVSKEIGLVVMGRKTFAVMDNKPLKGRLNYVITSSPEKLTKAIDLIPLTIEQFEDLNLPEYCVVGGYQIYKYFWNRLDVVYLSRHKLVEVEGDEFVPDLSGFQLIEKTENDELIKEIWSKNPENVAHLF